MDRFVESSLDAARLPDVEQRVADPSKRRHMWVRVSALMTIGGLVLAVLAASSAARTDADRSRQTFDATSGEVASTLQLAIAHENDLVINASAFILGNPASSNADFVRWTDAAQVSGQYPELHGLGELVIVTAAELPAYAARVANSAGAFSPGTFALEPPGNRPFYCLAPLVRTFRPALLATAGSDRCVSALSAVLLAARDSGQGAYLPAPVGKLFWLTIEIPIYKGGGVPATVAGRRATFVGWVAAAIDPNAVLARALQGHPGIAVSMRYHVGTSDVSFSAGHVLPGARPATSDLHNGWTVQAFGVVAGAGVLGHGNAVALLIVGVLLSLLLGVLVFTLGTGRARALRLVQVRTAELRHQALHDALTGLPNRALIMDRIEQLLARNRRHDTNGAVLFLDLDGFKDVNDTLGHAAGDQLLAAVAARLESTLRDADTIGRMGGDEFVVLIDGATVDTAPELVAERLLGVMRQPFDLADATMPLTINVSIGISVGDRATAGDLLRDADVALYEAKAAGKNRYEMFFPEMQTDILHRIELEFDLRSALDGGQLRLVYQPIYNLDDVSLVAVEALLRWEHPTLGCVLPDEFIPILERSGQIREVGRWVLLEACQQMATWHRRGDMLDVSVNVSGRQLDSDAIIDDVRYALEASGLDASSLIVEVTETAMMRDGEATARRLLAIRELGVRIAIDDFGTGYSSLAYLRTLPVDCLKIDRTFTSALATSPEAKAIVGMLVQLGKDLGLKTLAEGVETVGERDHLRGEQVDEAQGFLFARPLDPHTLETEILAPARPPTPASASVGDTHGP